jgi:hypothetical protein
MIGSPTMTAALLTGGGAAQWGDGPAPAGYHWEFVYANNELVTAVTSRSSAEPVVALVRN